MAKFIIIGALIGILLYYVLRRLNIFGPSTDNQSVQRASNIIELSVPLSILKQALRKTMYTIGVGIILLLITIIIASKIKIALILLPISLYLIGQFFILNNHIKKAKSQRLFFDKSSNLVKVETLGEKTFTFHLLEDVKRMKEFKSVQKNNGLLLGYYELITSSHRIQIPYLVAENLQTKPFFDKLQLFDRELETKLFPII